MSNSSSYAPPGESPAELLVERSYFDGIPVSGACYGVLFTLSWQTLNAFFHMPKGEIPRGFVVYTFAMLALGTIGFAGNVKITELAFINDRSFPGGPNAFEVAFFASPVNMMAFVAFIIMSCLANGLMLWRFWLIWSCNYWLSFFPAMMFLGSIVSSILLIISSYQANPLWAGQFGIAYWSLSLSLNIILSVLISLRIWFTRRRLHKLLGPQHAGRYVSVVAMLMESAALYAAFGLAFLITYATGNLFGQNILLPVLGEIQGIAPMLILYRVSQGRAWSQKTAEVASGNNNSGPLVFSNLAQTGRDNGLSSILSRDRGIKVEITSHSLTEWEENKPGSSTAGTSTGV